MKILFYILTAILFPLFANNFYFERVDIELDQIKGEKIIVIYDDFKGEHGEIVSQVILDTVKSPDYKLLKFDTNEIKIPVMEKILINLASTKGREVYFNNSYNPSNSLGSAMKVKMYKNLSAYKNLHIFQAGGNNDIKIVEYIEKFTHKENLARKINQNIYQLLCSRLDEIKAISRNERMEKIFNLGNVYGVVIGNFYRLMFNERDAEMKGIVQFAVDSIFIEQDIEIDKEQLVNLYSKNMNQFMFIHEVQSNKTNVVVVGSKNKFSLKEDSDVVYTLSCPVEGLVENDVLDEGYWIDKKGEINIGTSFSTPLYLSSIFNKNH